MKQILFNLGQVIAILLMFWPLYVILNFETREYPLIELAISILYCIYIYSNIDKRQNMEKVRENYYKKRKFAKTLMADMSDKEIIKHQEMYIERLLNDYF